MTDGSIIASPALTGTLTLAQQTTSGLPWWAIVLSIVFLLVCVILILTVLIQRPQGGGLSGAFGSGGGGSGQTAFGTRTGDALTVATVGIFIVYLGVAVGLNYMAQPSSGPVTPAAGAAPGDLPEDSAEGDLSAGASGEAEAIGSGDTETPGTEGAGPEVGDGNGADAGGETGAGSTGAEPGGEPETDQPG